MNKRGEGIELIMMFLLIYCCVMIAFSYFDFKSQAFVPNILFMLLMGVSMKWLK